MIMEFSTLQDTEVTPVLRRLRGPHMRVGLSMMAKRVLSAAATATDVPPTPSPIVNSQSHFRPWPRSQNPRNPFGVRHRQPKLLPVTLCATLADAQTFVAIADRLHDAARARLGSPGCPGPNDGVAPADLPGR